MPARVNGENFETEVISSEIPVLVDFYSDSCIPCKKIAPVLSKLESEYADRLKIVKVNAAFDDELVVVAVPVGSDYIRDFDGNRL